MELENKIAITKENIQHTIGSAKENKWNLLKTQLFTLFSDIEKLEFTNLQSKIQLVRDCLRLSMETSVFEIQAILKFINIQLLDYFLFVLITQNAPTASYPLVKHLRVIRLGINVLDSQQVLSISLHKSQQPSSFHNQHYSKNIQQTLVSSPTRLNKMPSMSNINTNRGNSNTINTTCGNTSESNAPESMIPLESIIKNSLGQFQHQITFKTVLIQACRFWELYYSKYLQYMEAVFLPVQMEFRNALINKFGFLVDVRYTSLELFYNFVVVPIVLPALKEYTESMDSVNKSNLKFRLKQKYTRSLIQMLVLVSHLNATNSKHFDEIDQIVKTLSGRTTNSSE